MAAVSVHQQHQHLGSWHAARAPAEGGYSGRRSAACRSAPTMDSLNSITESAWQNPQARHRILSAMKRREAKNEDLREELKASLEAEKLSLRQQVEAANERERRTLSQVCALPSLARCRRCQSRRRLLPRTRRRPPHHLCHRAQTRRRPCHWHQLSYQRSARRHRRCPCCRCQRRCSPHHRGHQTKHRSPKSRHHWHRPLPHPSAQTHRHSTQRHHW